MSDTKTFIVTYKREDGTEGSQTLSATSEKQAAAHAKKYHGADEVLDVTEIVHEPVVIPQPDQPEHLRGDKSWQALNDEAPIEAPESSVEGQSAKDTDLSEGDRAPGVEDKELDAEVEKERESANEEPSDEVGESAQTS